jgi:membrane fusion protein
MERASEAQGLFRKQAVNAAGYRWFSPVLIVTPPSALPSCIIALLAVGCLVVAMVVIEIPERIHATGVLLPKEGLLKVRAWRSGWVEELSISNGTIVTHGQVLMWLTDAQRAPDRQPEAIERLASLRHELQLLDQSIDQELAAMESRQRLNQRRKKLIERRLLVAESEHETRQQQAALQLGRSNRVAGLAVDGLVTAQSADELAASALQARALGEFAWQQVLALQDELLRLDEQLQQGMEAPALLRTQASMRREALLREISESEIRSTVELTAPGDGVVTGLVVRAGSFVQSGQVILTLHDATDALEARLYISADNATMISTGQRVELQLRAYPHQLFGTQSAIITTVSAVALPAHEIDVSIQISGPVFEIRAALERTTITARGGVWRLPPGTVFEADLVRRRWPLYRWLLRATADDESPHA